MPPPPVQVLLAANEGPVLLDSPHSGSYYPASFDHVCERSLLRHTEDTFVDDIFSFGPPLGATLVTASFPRSFIDVNRAAGDIDPLLLSPEEASALGELASAKSGLGMGLVWRLVGGHPIYNRPLARAEIDHRIDTYWRPYQQAVLQAWERITNRHGHGIHLNCHSMPSRSQLYAAQYGGMIPYDFVIGDRDGTTASSALVREVATFLRACGWSVGVNTLFKGVELVRLTGDPQRGRQSLQIEINKRTYMDEATLEKHAGFAQVRKDMRELVGYLIHRMTP